jgi:hypothetical protein
MNAMKERLGRYRLTACSLLGIVLLTGPAGQNARAAGASIDPATARVIAYWTSARRTAAVPRDLRIDSRGLGYLRLPDGRLRPFGHEVAAAGTAKSPSANGSGWRRYSPEPTAPSISDMDPGPGNTVGASQTFAAVITNNLGIKSVWFTIRNLDGSAKQKYSANAGANDTWSVAVSGLSDGNWSWWVNVEVTTKAGSTVTTSAAVNFTVDTGGPASGGGPVANAEWVSGGPVQTAAGRLYFEMPRNARRKGPWNGFVCTGAAITDGTSGRSIILTAAHCVYDDEYQAFSRNVLFIPNQAGTSGSATDLDCDNDPLGCWVPSFGVVDTDWTTSTFPANVAWDYAYYVVNDTGAHAGTAASGDSLESAAGALSMDFGNPPSHDDGTAGAISDDFTHALGYTLAFDPDFMYCSDDMTMEGMDNWWLPGCELGGGASGGPWIQPLSGGDGPAISVNSWGYTGSPGMAGPMLHGTSAECVLGTATSTDWSAIPATDGDAGVVVDCP